MLSEKFGVISGADALESLFNQLTCLLNGFSNLAHKLTIPESIAVFLRLNEGGTLKWRMKDTPKIDE